MKKKYLEEILISLSLSNLLFISSWRRLIFSSAFDYNRQIFPSSFDYLALLALVVCFAGFVLVGFWLVRELNHGRIPNFTKWLFIVSVFLIVNAFRTQFLDWEVWLQGYVGGRYMYLVGIFILGILLFLVTIKHLKTVVRITRTLLLILSPFVLITFTQTVMRVVNAERNSFVEEDSKFSKPLEPGKNTDPKSGSRIVWIIFDELEFRTPFESLPAGVELPAFRRMREQSFFATGAISPARKTMEAIPSLIIGDIVKNARPLGKSELELQLEQGGKLRRFSETSTIFGDVRSLGGNTGVVGFYHPYCRVLKDSLSSCYWKGANSRSDTMGGAVVKHIRSLIQSLPFGFRLVERTGFLANFTKSKNIITGLFDASLVEESTKLAANLNIDFSLIHLPIPHPPGVYNRQSRTLESGGGYLDNLVLSDIVLGEIRSAMENSGLWHSTTVIVSSDHNWRVYEHRKRFGWFTKEDAEISKGVEDKRIPFIVKLKDQKFGVEYNKPFNTVITRKLVVAIMKGDVSTPEELLTWLDGNRSKGG